MKYKLVVFDFDGTLADTFPWVVSMMDHLADQFGYDRVSPDEIDEFRSADPRTLLKKYSVPFWKLPSMASYVRGLMAQDADRLPMFAGAADMLRELAERGAELAIVTTNSYENVRQVLGPETLSHIQYFECGVGLLGKHVKLEKILRKSGIAPQECISIGDEIRDIQAARKARVTAGAVTWGYAKPDALRQYSPDLIFDCIAEIPARI